ncbi:MAG TPA: zinc-binding alcohol dehydrogenase [Anaerolineales bacterium]|nr:zinc-binding alcohol dehydrogenase [Anaerolineales bacterium]
MDNRAVYFTAPGQVEVRAAPLPSLQSGEILVKTLLSAISPGTEKLIYQGLFPDDLLIDDSLPGITKEFCYPLTYGYAAVGRIVDAGHEVDQSWLDRLVFAFQPHQAYCISRISDIHPVPPGIKLEDAVFLANMETAVNLVMDGAPLIGENIAVCGQGVVGLMTTALLSRFPLSNLITLDPISSRRQVSLNFGATASLTPESLESMQVFESLAKGGADLTFELSGSPEALNLAIQITGFSGRIVIGSWYGQKRASLDLGGRFHRSRIRLISSQVSTLAPALSGRWDKSRRFDLAWEMIPKICPGQLITHQLPLDSAPQAYRMLAEEQDETLQIVFTYD